MIVHILSIGNILFKIFLNSVEFTKNIIDFWEEGLDDFFHKTIPLGMSALFCLFFGISIKAGEVFL